MFINVIIHIWSATLLYQLKRFLKFLPFYLFNLVNRVVNNREKTFN